MIHANTMAAWREMDLPRRQATVCDVLERHERPMTDRQIAAALNRQDMNYVRPAVTALVDAGILEEVADVTCPTTGRKVRTVWWGKGQPKAKGPTLLDYLKAYYRAAERERTQLLRPPAEWTENAKRVRQLL